MEAKGKEKQKLEIMIDLETVSLKENAGWLEVAAVPFRLDGKELHEGEGFFVGYTAIVDLMSCYMAGMDMNGSQDFWMQQDPKAVARLVNGKKQSICNVVNDLFDYLAAYQETYEVEVWAQGTDFEFPKVEWCFRKFVEKEPPYSYWNKVDSRTFCNKMGIKKEDFEFEGVKHCALDDCKHQIKKVNAAYKILEQIKEAFTLQSIRREEIEKEITGTENE